MLIVLGILNEARDIIMQESMALSVLAEALDDSFFSAVSLIFQSRGRVVVSGMGKSGHIGRKISSTLSSTGQPSFFVHPGEAHHGDLGMISEDDIVLMLSNSGESAELFPVIDYCRRIGAKIVSITGNKNSTLSKNSDISLIFPKIKEATSIECVPTVSSIMTLAIGDALCICLLSKKNFSKEDFKKLHPGGAIGSMLTFVCDIMHKTPLPIEKVGCLMSDAIIKMTRHAMGCLGVIDHDQNLIGIITDGDLRRHMSDGILHLTVDDVMTKNPITMTKNVLASEALKLLETKKITNLFIVEGTSPIGLVHIHDLLKLRLV